ncbi:MAG: type VI secretion system baseplate subunit TssF [Actinomycetota bacterium]
MTTRLKDYFVDELDALRRQAVDFGRDHPRAARALALSGEGRSRDPQVEILLESFAYLAGRLQHQVDQDEALLPNALLGHLYPHLAAPVPTMMVAQVDVRSDGANFANGATLARGRYFKAHALSDIDQPLECRFRNCYETPLWPLEVAEVALTPINHYDAINRDPRVHSVLKVKIRASGKEPIQDFKLGSLRFHIDSEDNLAVRLYELFALDFLGVAVQIPGKDELCPLPASTLRWVGFAEDEAALPYGYGVHPGYRLVQEYFAFPEKFLFFDIDHLDLTGAIHEFDLLFTLGATPDRSLTFSPQSLRLNCIPLVNLFSQRIDPMPLDQAHYEYRLVADRAYHRYHEIYAIEELVASKPNATPRRIHPCFALDDFMSMENQDYFYVSRRTESSLSSVPGTETYVSFLDPKFDPCHPADEAIGGRALCTNRRLGESLQIGNDLTLEGPGPVHGVRIVSKPTAYQAPALLGEKPWALVSQLMLNHLSLSQGTMALNALRSILRLHLGRSGSLGWKQIDSLMDLDCRPVMRHRGRDGWRGFVSGLHIHLTIDSQRAAGSNSVLFAEVLRRFFALYASINTLVELSLETLDKKGNVKDWPPLAGDAAVAVDSANDMKGIEWPPLAGALPIL